MWHIKIVRLIFGLCCYCSAVRFHHPYALCGVTHPINSPIPPSSLRRIHLQLIYVLISSKCGDPLPPITPPLSLPAQGVLLSIVEVTAMSIFVFLALGNLPPHVSLFLLNGVFIAQTAIDAVRTPFRLPNNCRGCSYNSLEDQSPHNPTTKFEVYKLKLKSFFCTLLENKLVKVLAFLGQIGGIVGLAVYLGTKGDLDGDADTTLYIRPIVAFLVVLLVLSVAWSDKVQIWITKARNKVGWSDNARYKSSKLLVWYVPITCISG